MLEFGTSDLLTVAEGAWHPGRPRQAITGFSHDTRILRAGDCFVALRTERRDGHAFLSAARAAGAACALVGHPVDDPLPQLVVADPLRALQKIARWHRDRFPGPVVGITGSCGKTSTRKLLHGLLGIEQTHATEGNLNNEIGVPLTLLRIDPQRHSRAVIETGINQRGEMARLGSMVQPDATIFTMVGAAHLEGLGSLDGVADEKTELLRATRPAGFGVVSESAWCYRPVAQWIRNRGGIVCVPAGSGWSRDEAVDVWERSAATAGESIEIRVRRVRDGTELGYRLPKVSPGMVSNSALAAIAAYRLGVSPGEIAEAMAGWTPAEQRGVWLWSGRVRIYLDCYNANPSSMDDALEAFLAGSDPERERILILGGMHELGEHSAGFHAKVVSRLSWRPTDRFWLVGARALEYLAGFEGTLVEEDRVLHRDHAVAFAGELRNILEADRSVDIFIKGSRSCGLETILPPGLNGLRAGGAGAPA